VFGRDLRRISDWAVELDDLFDVFRDLHRDFLALLYELKATVLALRPSQRRGTS
jgi:hypothetical protein